MVRSANEWSFTFYMICILWLICSMVLIWNGFGSIVFCGTIFFIIWFFGLRDKFSNEETASAYSIFNINGQAIAGSYTSNHLEKQLRGGVTNTGGSKGGGRDEILRGSIAKADINNNNNNNSHPTITTSNKGSNYDQERLRRRKAAAAAAEKRLLSSQTDA